MRTRRFCSPRHQRQWRDRARIRRRAAQVRAAKIYLGARDTTSLQGLLAGSDKLVPLALDVTKPEQIAHAAAGASISE